MSRFALLPALAALAIASSTASAAPQIPTWANPYPAEPVATDGSPLPAYRAGGGWTADAVGHVLEGRSVAVEHEGR